MTIRTTVAFDPATVAHWERLTKRWGVSKSEALRRAPEVAEMPPSMRGGEPGLATPPEPRELEAMSSAQALDWLKNHSLVSAEAGRQWRARVQQTRDDFAARP